MHEPFWGKPSAISDSRETNYEHSPYVAELICTTTCIPWLFASGCGFLSCRGHPVKWAYALHFLSAAWGVAYHTSLHIAAQVFDRSFVMGWICYMMWMLMLIDSSSWRHSVMPKLLLLIGVASPAIAYLNLHLFVFAGGVAGCVVYGRRTCAKFPLQSRLWFWAVVVAVPALASFIFDDLSSETDPWFRHWHSVWHVLALVSTAYAMAFVLAVQLVQSGGRGNVDVSFAYLLLPLCSLD